MIKEKGKLLQLSFCMCECVGVISRRATGGFRRGVLTGFCEEVKGNVLLT